MKHTLSIFGLYEAFVEYGNDVFEAGTLTSGICQSLQGDNRNPSLSIRYQYFKWTTQSYSRCT